MSDLRYEKQPNTYDEKLQNIPTLNTLLALSNYHHLNSVGMIWRVKCPRLYWPCDISTNDNQEHNVYSFQR